MATVYLAQDVKHSRPVALKVLKPELAQSLGPERFRREITTAARLQHPHILSVFDSGETAGQLWFTMPYVEGETLRERLKRERCLPLDDALRIARETAQALQYAHERGIVHRDIKPENILLTPDGSTLVADFGIARALGSEDGGNLTGEQLTQTGSAIGTPQYMAPEQAAGDKAVDARADQYALAATLYEMLAGEPPFTANSAAALVAKRFTSPTPSVRTTRAEMPASVDVALQRGLALRADDRFATIAEFARAFAPASIITPAVSPTVAAPAARTPRGRVPVMALGIGVAVLLGAGALVTSLRGREQHARAGATGAPAVPRVAVLPFENLGDSLSGYFADGMTDEVRGKLAQLQGLTVIARSSSNEYRGTSKSAQEIARDLGASYLLTATVRWEKRPDGTSRVRVSPELVEIVPGGAPTTKWQQTFDAPLTDVFQVQGDIAGKVASALDVALGAGQQQVLAERPTENLQAYDAYLRGEAAWGGNSAAGIEANLAAIRSYSQAVALDSTFALAWAQLARVNSVAYYNVTPTPQFAEAARVASQRAVALAPTRPESHLALGEYFSYIHGDHVRALAAYRRGLEIAPTDADLLNSAAFSEWSLAKFEDAKKHLAESQALDPRSVNTLRRLSMFDLRLHQYAEAQGVVDRGLALSPTSLPLIQNGAMLRLAQGDLRGARQIIGEGLKRAEPASLAAYVANYFDLYWVLEDPEQQLTLRGTPAQYGDDRSSWALVQMQLLRLRGDATRARAYADTARIGLEAQLKAAPDNSGRLAGLALALAHLDRFKEAIEAGERGLARTPPSKDAWNGPYYQHQLVRVYIMANQPEKALDLLEPLLRMRYLLSPGWLKIDPGFDPLRGNPRFEKLAAGT